MIDANVLVSSSGWPRSIPDQVIDRVKAGQVLSIVSEPILGQVHRALLSPRVGLSVYEAELALEVVRKLSLLVHLVDILSVITAKESDNRILECAVAGQADVIVTGDRKHLVPFGSYAGIPILTPAQFLKDLLNHAGPVYSLTDSRRVVARCMHAARAYRDDSRRMLARMDAARTIPGLPDGATEVRVRFAPSPTGSLHVGGAKTALFNWLFARGEARRLGLDGTFILRVEDTDRNRFVPGAAEAMMDVLRWFGLDWQEGPDVGGPGAPYTQSERVETYRQHAEQLLAEGSAYRCFCSPERLQQVREAQQARSEAPGYDRHCRHLPKDEVEAKVAAGEKHVVRFATPRDGEMTIVDLIRGPISTQNVTLEDLVLLKSDGYPTYHLANVVDDHLMGITHVMRAAEWIPTAPIHALIYHAFGWESPALLHVPLILAPGGGKLSKRHGSTAMEEFRTQGYLPEALMNYLALLGWSFDATTEFFSKDDLLEKFSIDRLSASPATFDYTKLKWFNQHYINHIITLDDLTARVIPFLVNAGLIEPGGSDPTHPKYAVVRDVAALLKDRLELLTDAPDLMRFFLVDDLDAYDSALLVPKKTEPVDALHGLEAVLAALDVVDLNDEDATEARMRALAEELGMKVGSLFMAIRVAVSGRTQSPGLFGTMRVIGAERCRDRITQAIGSLREIAAVPAGD